MIRCPWRKKILVTGAKGFLGGYLVPALRRVYGVVDTYDSDVRRISAFSGRYDIVCHLAAFTKTGKGVSRKNLFDVNVNGSQAVMQYCRQAGARCIFASSSAVYKGRFVDSRLSEKAELKPVNIYGISKLSAENICRRFTDDFGVSVLALRIFNMYGPGQKAPFLIPYVLRQLSRGRQVRLDTPYAVRDFVHVKDVSRAFVAACMRDISGFTPLNIGSGQGFSVNELVKKISLGMGVGFEFKASGRKAEADFVVADTRKTEKLIGWKAAIPLEDGIKQLLGQMSA